MKARLRLDPVLFLALEGRALFTSGELEALDVWPEHVLRETMPLYREHELAPLAPPPVFTLMEKRRREDYYGLVLGGSPHGRGVLQALRQGSPGSLDFALSSYAQDLARTGPGRMPIATFVQRRLRREKAFHSRVVAFSRALHTQLGALIQRERPEARVRLLDNLQLSAGDGGVDA